MPQNNSAQGLSIGIIMDGNGRWAKKRGLPRSAGHKRGADVFDAITRYAEKSLVKSITYYAFSTENWARPKEELDTIMTLLGISLRKLDDYAKGDNRVVFLGDKTPLQNSHQKLMNKLEHDTKDNTGMVLNIAVNYGGQQEIVSAAQEFSREVAAGALKPKDITPELFQEKLSTRGQSMPDFILRTSGEQRLSNFLLWQAAYSELIFIDTLWPDFTTVDFDAVVAQYHSRSRRFGGV